MTAYLTDPAFIAAARALTPDELRAELWHVAAGIAAAQYRHSPEDAPQPDVGALVDELLAEWEHVSREL